MLHTDYPIFKYTPDEMNRDEFLSRFVVRQEVFEEIFEDIKETDYQYPSQHYIIIGQRGQGKTTLLRKIKIAVEEDEELSNFLLPIKFSEEQYQIRSLCRLWEEVADLLEIEYPELFEGIVDALEEQIDQPNYENFCFSYLEKIVNAKGKKLLLLIDNIDELFGKLKEKEQKQLREILLSSSLLKIVGGSTKMFEQHYDYGQPFYQFFEIIHLKGLNSDETRTLLRTLGGSKYQKRIEEIITKSPERIETLRKLTGGVPRTIVMLFEIFIQEDGDAFNDLRRILDEVTPLYKHRMDALSPTLQEIVHTLAMNWDAMPTKDIAKAIRMESKKVSAHLKELEKYQIVESESIGKNKLYRIQERFFNIWYLMRFGRRRDRNRVEWLVKFFLAWYSQDELEDKALHLIKILQTQTINPDYAYYVTEAISYAGISYSTEYELKKIARDYLKKQGSSLKDELSQSRIDFIKKIFLIFREKNLDQIIQKLKKLKIESKEKDKTIQNIIEFLQILLLSIQKNNIEYTIQKIKTLIKKYIQVEPSTLLEIEIIFRVLLALSEDDIDKAILSLNELDKKPTDLDDIFQFIVKLIKYIPLILEKNDLKYLKNIDQNIKLNTKDVEEFKSFIKLIKNAKLMEFIQDIQNDGHYILVNIAIFYSKQKEYSKAEKYFLQAIEQGNTIALHSLAWLYFKHANMREEALQLAQNAYHQEKNFATTYVLAIISLWSEEFSKSYQYFLEWLSSFTEEVLEDEELLILYLILLLSKGQYYKAKEFLELPTYKLKERLKPIWYALMKLMEDEYPHEYKKMGSEIEETVYEILEKIEELRKKYALTPSDETS